jgi:hypothetical protein
VRIRYGGSRTESSESLAEEVMRPGHLRDPGRIGFCDNGGHDTQEGAERSR